MSRTFLASPLFALALLPSPAQAETWCLKSFGQERGVCAFPSGRDCAQAARFSAFGGVCEREQLGNTKPAMRRSSVQR